MNLSLFLNEIKSVGRMGGGRCGCRPAVREEEVWVFLKFQEYLVGNIMVLYEECDINGQYLKLFEIWEFQRC